jgi:hypothetical protein
MKTGMCIEALLRMDFQKKRRMTSRVWMNLRNK